MHKSKEWFHFRKINVDCIISYPISVEITIFYALFTFQIEQLTTNFHIFSWKDSNFTFSHIMMKTCHPTAAYRTKQNESTLIRRICNAKNTRCVRFADWNELVSVRLPRAHLGTPCTRFHPYGISDITWKQVFIIPSLWMWFWHVPVCIQNCPRFFCYTKSSIYHANKLKIYLRKFMTIFRFKCVKNVVPCHIS